MTTTLMFTLATRMLSHYTARIMRTLAAATVLLLLMLVLMFPC